MMELVIIGIVSFIGTNIDDIFINTLLYSQAGKRKERQQVTAGVYLGMGILVILSISGAAGIQTLPVEWVASMLDQAE
jgi:cadmium resistance protein CadD (predicted permease)